MTSYMDEPRHNSFDVIVQRRISEYTWWHLEYTEAWRRNEYAGTEVDRQLVGIIKATRDAYLTDANTIDYLDATARLERRTIRALRRLKRRQRTHRVGTFIIHCLEYLGARRLPIAPGSAPR